MWNILTYCKTHSQCTDKKPVREEDWCCARSFPSRIKIHGLPCCRHASFCALWCVDKQLTSRYCFQLALFSFLSNIDFHVALFWRTVECNARDQPGCHLVSAENQDKRYPKGIQSLKSSPWDGFEPVAVRTLIRLLAKCVLESIRKAWYPINEWILVGSKRKCWKFFNTGIYCRH